MLNKVINYICNNKFIISTVIIAVSMVIYIIIKKIISKFLDKIYNENDSKFKKKQTYLKLLKNICKYLVIVIDFIIVLSIYNIDVSSIVAGLGIISLISGLALQDALKDIIAGFNIIVDNYYSVGDVIEVEGVQGKVISIGLKTTKIKDIYTENIFVVANRNIVKALNISHLLDIDIPLPYEEDISRIEEIIDEIINLSKENKNIEKIEYKGVQEFGASAIFYKIRMRCKPELKPQVKRDVLRTIKIKLDENKIKIPYTQIDVHKI